MMLENKLFMPKATAIWLIENTSLTFQQIADYCGLHLLEIESLANNENSKNLQGQNPLTTGELSAEDIYLSEKDPKRKLTYIDSEVYNHYTEKSNKGKTPHNQKYIKLGAILWVLNHYPNINKTKLSKLFKTTVNMIKSLENKSYAHYNVLIPKDPVALGLCSNEALTNLIND